MPFRILFLSLSLSLPLFYISLTLSGSSYLFHSPEVLRHKRVRLESLLRLADDPGALGVAVEVTPDQRLSCTVLLVQQLEPGAREMGQFTRVNTHDIV